MEKIKKIPISEVFYSVQGEGKTTGYPAVFMRLAGCNLMCGGQGTQFDKELHNGATWRCDTIEVWMKGKAKAFEDIFDKECSTALANGAHLVVTGGEPLMHEAVLIEFFKYLDEAFGYHSIFIEVETNGTIKPSDEFSSKVNLYNCSPKLSNSGNLKNQRFNLDALTYINEAMDSIFKFVVSSDEDWNEIQEDFLPLLDRNRVWLMPAGENQELLNQTKQIVVEIAKKNYLKFTNRLHIEIWNKKTGV